MTDPDDYEAEWEELDPKVIQVQILMELQAIRRALTDGQSDAQSDSTMYECKRCGANVEADERARHAQQSHKAPADMVDGMFEVVE